MATLEAPVRPRARACIPDHLSLSLFSISAMKRMPAGCAPPSPKFAASLAASTTSIIGGKHVKTTDKIKSLNPAKPSEIVGIHQKAGKEHVEPAMTAALKAFESWSRTTVEERASLLFRVADTDAPAQDGIHGVAGFRSQQELG